MEKLLRMVYFKSYNQQNANVIQFLEPWFACQRIKALGKIAEDV